MLFHAHAYHAIKRSGGVDPERIVGAILPDSAITGVVGWTDLHNEETTTSFIRQLGRPERGLGLGLLDHRQLDRVAHDSYYCGQGYAFLRQNTELRGLVARACGFESPQDATALAHNFIEAGVDVHLIKAEPDVRNAVRTSFEQANVKVVASRIASAFNTEPIETEKKLQAFVDLIQKYDLRDVDEWTRLLCEVIELVLSAKPEPAATKNALQLAIELTAHDYVQPLRKAL